MLPTRSPGLTPVSFHPTQRLCETPMTLFAPERGRGPIHIPGQHPLPPSRTQVHDRAAAGSLPRRRAPRAFQHCARPRQDRVRDDSRPGGTHGRQTLAGWRGGVRHGGPPRKPAPAAGAVSAVRPGRETRLWGGSGDAGPLRPRDASGGHWGARSSPRHRPRRGPPNRGSPEPTTRGAHSGCPVGAGTPTSAHKPHCWRAEKTEVGPRSCLCPGSAPPPPALPETSSGCLGVLAVSVSPASLGRRAGHVQAGLGTAS